MGWGSCWKIRIKPQKENNLGVAHALFDHKGDDNKKDNQIFRLLTSNAIFSTDDPPAFVFVFVLSLFFSVEFSLSDTCKSIIYLSGPEYHKETKIRNS